MTDGAAVATPGTELPTISFPRLWHVGSLDVTHKRPGSYEGACLSVSRCPGAWREIGEGLVTGDCWVADTSHVAFLDARGMDEAQTAAVLAWGVAEGLCEPATLWRTSQWDDELEDTVHQTFDSRDEAVDEMGLDEDEDPEDRIEEVHEHRSTPRLDLLALAHGPSAGDASVVDLLLPLWAWASTDLVGVWWDDRFDPVVYSAPRGGVLPARMDRLTFTPEAHEPYEPCDAEEDEDE
jgi:hypothetical protein